MQKLRIRNWDRWQSYRKDRGQPPWIKVHRALLRDWEWISLTDAQRGQLVAIWLLAGDHNGVIPASPPIVQRLCHLETEPDLQYFVDHGFMDGDATMTPTGCQGDANMTHQRRVEESREEKAIVGQNGKKPPRTTEAEQVIDHLNKITGKQFIARSPDGKLTATGSAVANLLKSGYTVQQCKTVIARKWHDWQGDPKMLAYLRPKTLFAKSNFENYLGECVL